MFSQETTELKLQQGKEKLWLGKLRCKDQSWRNKAIHHHSLFVDLTGQLGACRKIPPAILFWLLTWTHKKLMERPQPFPDMAKYSLEDKVSPDREPLCKVTPIIKSKGTTALRSPNSQLSSALAPLYLLNLLWLWEVGQREGQRGAAGQNRTRGWRRFQRCLFVCLFFRNLRHPSWLFPWLIVQLVIPISVSPPVSTLIFQENWQDSAWQHLGNPHRKVPSKKLFKLSLISKWACVRTKSVVF